VLRPLPGGQLLGLDTWTRFQVFTPLAMARAVQCTEAVHRAATAQDCPLALANGGAEACCAQGKLQGCNILGNRLALSGHWLQAAEHYTTVCRAGVREGCENLVTAQGNDAEGGCTCTAGPAVQGRPQWPARGLRRARHPELGTDRSGRALQKAADDAASDDTPPPRHSNRKR
jgi:hypothetical protein